MNHVTLADYFQGRDRTYAHSLTPQISLEAQRTVDLANKFLDIAMSMGVDLERRADTGGLVNSGWRPAALNAQVQNAAPNSKHITAQAIDLFDPEGAIDGFCLTTLGMDTLATIGLWLEHPASTKGWCHLQTIPPKSLNRVFYP